MSDRKPREFKDSPAVRARVPILLGITGASSSGKTYSALRLATGIQRVTGGEIFFVDTEASRALHYASNFKFRHVPFAAPFSSLDYLDVLRDCSKKGAAITIVDSFSHEHEGEGGYLEFHDSEVDRLATLWKTNTYKTQIPAWGEPAKRRRKLINGMLQLNSNFIFCFRAKEKLKIKTGEDPVNLGWMPIGGDEFIYELLANALLMPGANGVPTWNPQEPGEKKMVKNPEMFRRLFAANKGPLDENMGEQIALWASGKSIDGTPQPKPAVTPAVAGKPVVDVEAAIARLKKSNTLVELGMAWKELSAETQAHPDVTAAKDNLKLHFTAPPPDEDDKWGG
jgi:hypothetical protein